MSSRSRIGNLPSSYSSEAAKWKVLHKKPKNQNGKKKDFKCLSSTVVDFTKNASLRGVKSEISGILQNDESLFWIIFLESAV